MTEQEQEIVSGCQRGEVKFQKKLYELYSKKMFGVCLRYSNDHDQAKDLLQDGFLKVFQYIGNFKGEGSFEGWIRRIMVNTSLETFRKAASKFPHVDIEDHHEDIHQPADFRKYDFQYILARIQELAPGYRAVFNLFVIEGYHHDEIADMLGISESTSKSQLSRARKILQEALASEMTRSNG